MWWWYFTWVPWTWQASGTFDGRQADGQRAWQGVPISWWLCWQEGSQPLAAFVDNPCSLTWHSFTYPIFSSHHHDICLSIFYDRLPIAINVSARTGGWWSLKPRLSHGSTSDFTNTKMWHSTSFVFVFYKHHDLTLKIFCICTLKISRCGDSQTFSIPCKNFSCVSEHLNQKHFFVWMHSIRWMIFIRTRIQ